MGICASKYDGVDDASLLLSNEDNFGPVEPQGKKGDVVASNARAAHVPNLKLVVPTTPAAGADEESDDDNKQPTPQHPSPDIKPLTVVTPIESDAPPAAVPSKVAGLSLKLPIPAATVPAEDSNIPSPGADGDDDENADQDSPRPPSPAPAPSTASFAVPKLGLVKLPPINIPALSAPAESPAPPPGIRGLASLPLSRIQPKPEEPESTRRPTLQMSLSLEGLGRAKTEEEESRKKLEVYEKVLSEITPWLYLSADPAARDLEMLRSAGITNVLNAAGMVCSNYHSDKGVDYRTFYLIDGPTEDIDSVAYDAIEYLDSATDLAGTGGSPQPHRALIHCWQGVSRSAALVILYLMFRRNMDYDSAYQYVRERRPIARPNVGFMCQLLAWQKRLQAGVEKPRLAIIRPHSDYTPAYFVPKNVAKVRSSELDPESCAVLHAANALFVWIGSSSSLEHLEAARKYANRLVQHEHAPSVVEIQEGDETEGFWNLLEGGKQGFVPHKQPDDAFMRSRVVVAGPHPTPKEPSRTPERLKVQVKMFGSPDWDEIELFDADDLDEDGVFVFFAKPTDGADNPATFSFVWVGSARVDVDDAQAAEMARECFEKHAIECEQRTVVKEGEEGSDFWDLFSHV